MKNDTWGGKPLKDLTDSQKLEKMRYELEDIYVQQPLKRKRNLLLSFLKPAKAET